MSEQKNMFLICNAHIDPVWQWEWEEGVGAAISTFRVAANLCEEYDTFVFNHNEAVLYQWIEDYEPELFHKIQKLVREGKWHIMGGWYLQPDCNMPGGESFTRQITQGLHYFKEKFGARPTVAINFDPFGHTKGLVQILEQCGYNGYVYIRPKSKLNRFVWKGFNNSRVTALYMPAYNSPLGKVAGNIRYYLDNLQLEENNKVMLWGVGNHGGGPSKEDLKAITELSKDQEFGHKYGTRLIHATLEQFFEAIREQVPSLPVVETSLQHENVGCYTSQIRIKQKHRKLENELLTAEKMASHASLLGLMEYPEAEFNEAWKDLMFAQFHDILPGSSIQPVEEAGIRVLDHGLEMASRIRGKAFFKLSAGQKQAKEGELPILVYNPHPFKHSRVIDCEFMLSDQNYRFEFSNPVVYQGDQKLLSQAEKEMSNIPIDWRKRVLFEAELEPLSMNRFDVRIEVLPEKPAIGVKAENGKITIANECYRAVLNTATGWLDSYLVDGKEYLRPGAGKILIQQDIEDSWGSTIQGFPKTAGEFALADPSLAARIAGVQSQCLEPVRVIEDGKIRTVVEALFGWENSRAVVRYYFPKTNSEIRIHVRTIFSGNEKMLKLSIPTTLGDAKYLGRTAFGIDELRSDGNEAVAQEYVILADEKDAVSVINTGNYGSDCRDGEIRMSLLRTPAYCAYAIKDRQILPQDQFSERMDQGERLFDFYLNASGVSKRMRDIEQESSSIQEPPMAVCFFPPETGQTPAPLAIIDNPLVKLSAIKKAADGDGMILRVFNASFETQTAKIQLPIIDKQIPLKLGSFEVRTFRLVDGMIKDSTLCEDL